MAGLEGPHQCSLMLQSYVGARKATHRAVISNTSNLLNKSIASSVCFMAAGGNVHMQTNDVLYSIVKATKYQNINGSLHQSSV